MQKLNAEQTATLTDFVGILDRVAATPPSGMTALYPESLLLQLETTGPLPVAELIRLGIAGRTIERFGSRLAITETGRRFLAETSRVVCAR